MRAGIADAADATPFKCSAETLGAILDDEQAVPVRDTGYSGHVGRQSEHVHRQDCTGPGRNRVFDLVRIDVEALPIDIHEDRHRAQVLDGFGGRRKRERAGNDLIAGSYADG